MRLSGQHAAVTGGNSGIGLAIARAFRNEGAQVAAATDLGSGTVSTRGDVSNLADLDRFYAEIGQTFGGLDVLVANAGVYSSSPLTDTTPEFFHHVSDVNFRGTFFTVQRALSLLRDGASVILVTFAAELQPRGIRVNALSPGIIDTPIFDRLGMKDGRVEELKRDLQEQVPMNRLGTPDEVARAAVFLASEDSSYITGAELPISGGLGQL